MHSTKDFTFTGTPAHVAACTILPPIFVLFCACAFSMPVAANVYYFIDESGTTHFSDRSDDTRYRPYITETDQKAEQYSAKRTALTDERGRQPIRTRYTAAVPEAVYRRFNQEIEAAARANQLEAALLHAVIAVESGYNPRAVSPKGALGLMQLMPHTAREYHVADPLNAAQNIQGGARFIRALLNRYNNDLQLTLAAYNAGIGRVEQYGNTVPPFAETAEFVPAVLERYGKNQRENR